MRALTQFLVLTTLAFGPLFVFCLLTGRHQDQAADFAAEDAATPQAVRNKVEVEGESGIGVRHGSDGNAVVGAQPDAARAKTTGSRQCPGKTGAKRVRADRPDKVPVFKGFEDARYQQYDDAIRRYVLAFNRDRANWTGATREQTDGVPQITAAQVKAHMIQETGGRDFRSRAAWKYDPLQVNVPGDWTAYKRYVGLRPPRHRNDGNGEANLKAGIKFLARKGFGAAGQPAANRPEGAFDTWEHALQRYNGRSSKTANGMPYRDVYADRIVRRAANPTNETPIAIR